MYVLQNAQNQYLFEYLMGELFFCQSIQKAMTFQDQKIAVKFKKRIYKQKNVDLSVQTRF